jgi:predicted metal-dependent hydrolase
MPAKAVDVPSVGVVNLYKRKGARNIRISISSTGEVRVTLPMWAPYKLGYEFALSKAEWIASRKPVQSLLVHKGQVGKAHRLYFSETAGADKIRTRIKGQGVWVYLPVGTDSGSVEVQKAAGKAAAKVLTLEAERLLFSRLKVLALEHGFTFRSVSVKRLRGRWGSCNQHTDITLNCFLMQLPWELIDYVLLHELVHTRVMSHGAPFWRELDKYVPDLKTKRAEIKRYYPVLKTS